LDHPAAIHAIALHWRRSSPASEDFHRLADDLTAVKREIRAARGDRFG
jgi:LysR family hydrogen peroxide-inducible transcriptional activator